MTESVTSLGVNEAPTAEGARPGIDLPIGALIRISAFCSAWRRSMRS